MIWPAESFGKLSTFDAEKLEQIIWAVKAVNATFYQGQRGWLKGQIITSLFRRNGVSIVMKYAASKVLTSNASTVDELTLYLFFFTQARKNKDKASMLKKRQNAVAK